MISGIPGFPYFAIEHTVFENTESAGDFHKLTFRGIKAIYLVSSTFLRILCVQDTTLKVFLKVSLRIYCYCVKVAFRVIKTKMVLRYQIGSLSAPSKHLLVFKTSSRHVLKTSSTRLQRNNFTSSTTSWKHLEDPFKTSRKTSWKTKNSDAEGVLKTFWKHILKTSSRRLRGKKNFYWWYLYQTNLNVYLINLCFTNYIWEI